VVLPRRDVPGGAVHLSIDLATGLTAVRHPGPAGQAGRAGRGGPDVAVLAVLADTIEQVLAYPARHSRRPRPNRMWIGGRG
jgi:hypothetical protein